MSAEEDIDIDNLLLTRANWRPFCPLIHQRNFMTSWRLHVIDWELGISVDHQIARCLDNEIADTYNDLRLRKIDVIDKRVQMKELRKVLLDPKVEEYMNSMVPKQGNVCIRLLSRFIMPISEPWFQDYWLSLLRLHFSVTSQHQNFQGLCQRRVSRRQTDGSRPVSLARSSYCLILFRQSRSILEDSYCVFLGEYIRNQKIYSKYSCERELDALKMIKRFPTKTFSIGFVYDNRVPCAVMTSMFIRACETFYPQLMPLTFYWQSVMSEVWSEDYSRRFSDSKWMSMWAKVQNRPNLIWFSVRKFAFLWFSSCNTVNWSLRSCERAMCSFHIISLGNLSKNGTRESRFSRKSVRVLQLLSDQYLRFPDYAVKRKEISKSPFFNKSVGEMFAALVNFYITTLPLGDWAIELDRGCVGAVEHVQDVPIYSVLQWTFIFDPVFRDKIVIFRKIMR